MRCIVLLGPWRIVHSLLLGPWRLVHSLRFLILSQSERRLETTPLSSLLWVHKFGSGPSDRPEIEPPASLHVEMKPGA